VEMGEGREEVGRGDEREREGGDVEMVME